MANENQNQNPNKQVILPVPVKRPASSRTPFEDIPRSWRCWSQQPEREQQISIKSRKKEKLKNLIAEAGRDDYPNDVHSHELKNVLCCSPDVSDSLQLNFFKEARHPGYSNMAVEEYSNLVMPITVSNVSKNPCIRSMVCQCEADQVAGMEYTTSLCLCKDQKKKTFSNLIGRITSMTCPRIRLVKPSPASSVLPSSINEIFEFGTIWSCLFWTHTGHG